MRRQETKSERQLRPARVDPESRRTETGPAVRGRRAKGDSMENQWQPGRWNHPGNIKHAILGISASEFAKLAGKPVHTRFDEYIANQCQASYKRVGAMTCFEVVIHPDDAKLYFPKEAEQFTSVGACSCCILTD